MQQNLTPLETKEEVPLSDLDNSHDHGIHDFCALPSQTHLRSNLKSALCIKILVKLSVDYAHTCT